VKKGDSIFPAKFKAKVAMEALEGGHTLAVIHTSRDTSCYDFQLEETPV
jgi:hypothetical protein